LKVLRLGTCEEHSIFVYEEVSFGMLPDAWFVPGDIERLVCCCPALEQLCMPEVVQPGVDVSALLGLTALTGLFIGGEVYDDDVANSVLAEMSSLRELALCLAPQLTDQGLLGLAALTGLTVRQLEAACAGLLGDQCCHSKGRKWLLHCVYQGGCGAMCAVQGVGWLAVQQGVSRASPGSALCWSMDAALQAFSHITCLR
jgi:hypothetical protein